MQSFLQSDQARLVVEYVDLECPIRSYHADDILEFEPDGTRLVSPRVAANITKWRYELQKFRGVAERRGLVPVRVGRNLRYRMPDLMHFLARLEVHGTLW